MIYRVGDIVALRFESCMRQGVTEKMLKHQGEKFRIKKIRTINPPHYKLGGIYTYYELKGFVSKLGIPYAVTIDMLQPVKGAKYGK